MDRNFTRSLWLWVFLLVGICASAQNNCLPGWRYSHPVSVRNILFGTLNDYQVKIDLNTQDLISNGKMNADGSDLRITLEDCCTEIPYWIQSGLNTPNTIIWTRVPQLASRDTTWLTLYYGNPAANTPISDLDQVHFSMGNDSMGTDSAQPGITVATEAFSAPIRCWTVRFRVYSGDSAQIRFKSANDTNMVLGQSPVFSTGAAPGFYSYDSELPVGINGHVGWYTSTGARFLNSCTPNVPCPGSCGRAQYSPGDLGLFGDLNTDTCGVVPSMKVWYRRFANTDPVATVYAWSEFDRLQPFAVTAPGGQVMCFNDSLPLYVNHIGALSYQWYLNGNIIPNATDTTLVAHVDGYFSCVADFGMFCQTISSDSMLISYLTPDVELGDTLKTCSELGLGLTVPNIFANYLWSDGSINRTLFVTTNGSYWVQVTDSFGCVDRDTVEVIIYPLPQPVITVTGSSTVCYGQTVSLTGYDPNWYAYKWIPGSQTSANINVWQPGNYAIIVFDENFCSDTSAFVTLSNYPTPSLLLGPDTGFCDGDSLTLDVGAGWTQVTWPDSSTGNTFTVNSTGIYVAEVADSNGCITTDTISVTAYPLPTVNLGPSDTICANDSLLLDAGPGFDTYLWTRGDTTQSIQADVGPHRVTVTDSNGCSSTSGLVYLFGYPTYPALLIYGDINGLTVTNTLPNYQWYMDSVAIPGANGGSYYPTGAGTYWVEFTDPYGCYDQVSNMIVILTGITAEDIPQGFSPNGDGINDRFEIARIDQFPGNQLKVINRWGQLVYNVQGYNNSFDGHSDSGSELPDGTYYYELNLGNGQVFQDYLIINR